MKKIWNEIRAYNHPWQCRPSKWEGKLIIWAWMAMIVDARCTMDDDRGTMIEGRWSMIDGRWTMDDGRWSMVDGRWTMVDGRWTRDDRRCMFSRTVVVHSSAFVCISVFAYIKLPSCPSVLIVCISVKKKGGLAATLVFLGYKCLTYSCVLISFKFILLLPCTISTKYTPGL